jgi:hypothetical protein
MEPTRGVLIREASIGRYSLPPDTPIWIVGTRGESCEVEYRDARGVLPTNCVVQSPVVRPTEAQLRSLDACFGLPDSAFTTVHVDPESLFVVEQCNAHGMLFLRDTRGTIGLYERITLLKPEESGDWVTIWSRYHQMSDDWLNLAGRTW